MTELRLAIVGLGPWGRNLLRAFSTTPRARVVAVCDENPARLARLEVPGAAAMHAFEAVLQDESIDAVVLATPPATHAAQCLAALDAGKHVFVEKPIAMRARDAARIEMRAARSSLKLMVGHILHYHPAFMRLLAMTSNGELGRIRAMHSMRLGAAEMEDATAAWWALAPHDVSAMCALVGSPPTGISAAIGTPPQSGMSCVYARLTFANGCTGRVVASAHAERKTRRLLVVGTRATIVFDDVAPAPKLRLYSGELDWRDASSHTANLDAPSDVVSTPTTEPLFLEARHFVEAVLDGKPIPTDATEGRNVVTILEAAERSWTSGGASIQLGPEAPEASAGATG